jgi:hypothetical protein
LPKKKIKKTKKASLNEEELEKAHIWLREALGEEEAPLEKKRELLLARSDDPNDIVRKLIEIGFVDWKDPGTLYISEKVRKLFKPGTPLTESEELERKKMLDNLLELDFT